MPHLRLGLAQVNATVGDLAGNRAMVVNWAQRAVSQGAHVVAFPEMVLPGYPIEDLALRRSFALANRASLEQLAAELAEAGCGNAVVVVGHLDHDEQGIRNAASFLYEGRVVATYAKHHLPNYGVFDEERYFAPGTRLPIVRLQGMDVGVVICEDIWQAGGPVSALGEVGVDLVLCINGSPYEMAKDDQRTPLVQRRAAEAGAPLAYVNLVGAQDELVFDGDSLVAAPDGTVLARAQRFTEQLLLLDVDGTTGSAARSTVNISYPVRGFAIEHQTLQPDPVQLPQLPALPEPEIPEPMSEELEVWSALVTGLRDYVHKNGFRSVAFGFSGGIDSALCAALCADAVGAQALYGVSMPSEYSSQHSQDDAAELARRIGCHFEVRPISEMVRSFVGPLGLSGLAEENVQARCRGLTLMALSNQHGHLVLAPGNKSELAVGYSTIYGDAVGGFAPIKDVPKTLVYRLARWRNTEAEKRGETPPIPENSLTKPPSAELRPGQVDQDSLPDYDLLDAILDSYIEGDRGYAELLAAGFEQQLVQQTLRLVDRAEYKRRQYPPGTKVTWKAFGRDRRLPITNHWREEQV